MKKIEKLKEEGNQFFKKKDYENASSKYKLAIDKCDQSKHSELLSKLYSNLCVCQMNLNQLTDALKSSEECISNNPSWIKGYLRKMSVLSKMEGEEKKKEIVKIMYYFLKSFPGYNFSTSEMKWIEELQKHVGYYRYPMILKEVFSLDEEKDKKEKGEVLICCVDSKERGHFTSVMEAVYTVDNKTRILVLNGTYREVVLFDKKELEVIGEDPHKTIIELKGYPKNVSKDEVLDIEGTLLLKESKVKFSNLTITNALSNQQNSAIAMNHSSVGLVNCHLSCPTGVGIYFRQSSSLILQKCEIKRCIYGLMNTGKGRLTMIQTSVSFCDKTGVALKEGCLATIKKCALNDNRNQAIIVLGNESEVNMTKCKVSDNGFDEKCKTALLFSAGVKKVILDDNEFMKNNFQAVQLKNCNSIITNNTFGVQTIALGIQHNANAIVKNNTFKNLGFGVWIYKNGSGNVHIEENEFENTPIEVSKFPGEKDPVLVKQEGIIVKEYDDVVESYPKRRKINNNKKD